MNCTMSTQAKKAWWPLVPTLRQVWQERETVCMSRRQRAIFVVFFRLLRVLCIALSRRTVASMLQHTESRHLVTVMFLCDHVRCRDRNSCHEMKNVLLKQANEKELLKRSLFLPSSGEWCGSVAEYVGSLKVYTSRAANKQMVLTLPALRNFKIIARC